METQTMLKPSEVAKILNVAHNTVLNWISTGSLRAIKLPGGSYRIRSEDVEKVLNEDIYGKA